MKKPSEHSAIPFLGLVLMVIAFFGMAGTVCANTLSSQDNVVRIQGSPTTGATSSLIGLAEYGNTLRMVFLGSDHVVEQRVVTTIGFGNLGAPDAVDLNASGATIYKMGPTGTEDLAIIGITVDLNTLTPTQQAFLKGLTPFSVVASPPESSLPFGITAYGYGLSNASDAYGTQNMFTNQISEYRDFTGSYTTDINGDPLTYTQSIEIWNFAQSPGHGAGVRGFSGAPLIYNGEIQGIQVNGSRSESSPENWGLRFTDAEVAWISTQRDNFLVPLPGTAWLFGSGLLGLAGWRRFRKG